MDTGTEVKTSNSLDKLSEKLKQISGEFGTLGTVIEKSTGLVSSLSESMGGFNFAPLDAAMTTFSQVGAIAGEIAGTISTFMEISEGIKTLMGAGSMMETLFSGVSLGAAAPIIAILGGIVLGIMDLWATSSTFRDNVSQMWEIICNVFAIAKENIWDKGLLPLWESIKELFASLYEIYESSGLKEIFEAIATAVGYIAVTVFGSLMIAVSELIAFVTNSVTFVVDILRARFEAIKGFIEEHKQIFEGIKMVWKGITDFIAGIFTADWGRAWGGIKDIFAGIWTSLVGIVKGPLNTMIGFLNSFISKVAAGINAMIRGFNKLKINIPDNPLTGKMSIGFDIPLWTAPQIPYLANGGMLRAGQLFVARERGPELITQFGNRTAVMNNGQAVKAITEGIVDKVMETMVAVSGIGASGGQQVVVTLQGDTQQLFRVIQTEAKKYEREQMRPAFE